MSLMKWLADINKTVSTWSFATWYVLVSSVLLIASVIMGIVALVRIHSLKKEAK